MSKNKSLVSQWKQNIRDKLLKSQNSQSCGNCSNDNLLYFTEYFGDTNTDVTRAEDNYTISDQLSYSQQDDGSVTVSGTRTITKTKSWVWSCFSGFMSSWKEMSSMSGSRLHSVSGQWCNGRLCCGQVAVFRFCNDVHITVGIKCGLRHGLCVATFSDQVIWVASYSQGKLEASHVSIDCESGGLLWEEDIYLYPDMETALVGDFSGAEMSSSRQAEVSSISIDSNDMLVVKCSKCYGPEFSFCPSGPDNFGLSDPLLRDPYECKYIRVLTSGMEAGGQGVFTQVKLPPNTLAAVFNGYKVPLGGGHDPAEGLDTAEERYERLAYNIHMPEDEHFFLDFPPNKADLTIYRASLGHKVNHSFLPNCKFGVMWHPRWGRVRTVVTTVEVDQGAELLVDYGYDLLRCPDWYRDLWTIQIGQPRGMKYWEYKK